MPSCRLHLLLVAAVCSLGRASSQCDNFDDSCLACNGDDGWSRCTQCKDHYELYTSGAAGEGSCVHQSCAWKEEYAEDWYGKILVGSIVGAVLTIITTVVASLPVCCGVMKNSNLIPIAVALGVVAAICLFIPLITGMATTGGLVDDICNSCDDGCTEQDRSELTDAIGALGVIVAYIHGFGFIVVILGAVTLCLSCCMCCPCCGPLQQAKLEKQQAAGGAAPVQGQVVGSAACS